MMQYIRQFVKHYPPLYDVVRRGRRLVGMKDPAYACLDAFSRERGCGGVYFVQIGANDGLRNDPVREFVIRDRWRGLLIEPLPSMFKLLQKNYAYLANQGLTFVNAAVSGEDGQQIFYTFNDKYLQTLSLENALECTRKSSFNRTHVERFAAGRHPSEAIVSYPVPCLTFSNLLARYMAEKQGAIDLLVIDAEGHEPQILAAVDFEVHRPSAIFFESHSLGELSEPTLRLLLANGYELCEVGGDTFAV
jgi:FkbM family methyltransferase